VVLILISLDIVAHHGSFLDIDPTSPEFMQVEYILLDPSCSGSGIVSRLDQLVDGEVTPSSDRLQSLAEFQKSCLLHAAKCWRFMN
jgi:putative methyltransferase